MATRRLSRVSVAQKTWPWRKLAIVAGLLVLAGTGALWLTVGKSGHRFVAHGVLLSFLVAADAQPSAFLSACTMPAAANAKNAPMAMPFTCSRA